MDRLAEINAVINDFIWGPVMLALMMGVGAYFTIKTGFFQIRKFPMVIKKTLGTLGSKQNTSEHHVSPFQALTVAMASTVGVGNVAGVATAIVSGGPGAVFWMWLSAFVGMMTKYAEVVLSVRYRQTGEKGQHYGGPMYYIEKGLGWRWLAVIFAILGGFASFGIGNLTQTNTIADSLNSTFGIPKLLVGVCIAVAVGLVIFGGIKRIGKVTETFVPVMAVFYIIGGIVTLVMNASEIPSAFGEIFSNAFSLQSAGSGVMGYTIMRAMRYGAARGVFSNEAGLGSAPIAHAAAGTDNPVKQGFWGIFETFADTIIICTITALVIITSGLAGSGLEGASLTAAAFSQTLGSWGGAFVSLAILLFALSTILGWAYYGERCWLYVAGDAKWVMTLVRCVWLPMIVISSVGKIDLIWDIADTLNGMMMIPNLIALFALRRTVVTMTKNYLENPDSVRM